MNADEISNALNSLDLGEKLIPENPEELRAHAMLLFNGLPDPIKDRWNRFLVLPTEAHIVEAVHAVETHGMTAEAVDSLKDPVKRLTAIHIVNGLRVSGLAPVDLPQTDVRHHPSVEAYCNRERYHSLLPLVTYYDPHRSFATFDAAVEDFVKNKGTSLLHSAVRVEVLGLLREVVKV